MNRNPSQEQKRNAEAMFVMRAPTRFYTPEEVCRVLDEAERRGMDMGKNSPLEYLTIGELDAMLNPAKN
jgi:hypothetical protein